MTYHEYGFVNTFMVERDGICHDCIEIDLCNSAISNVGG
jgi:hypothetical protein